MTRFNANDRRWHFWPPLPFLSALKSLLNNLSSMCLAINVKLTSPRLLESHSLEKWGNGTFSWLLASGFWAILVASESHLSL